jgi:hypothetical protein
MIFEKSSLCHIINHSFIYFIVENCYIDHEKSLLKVFYLKKSFLDKNHGHEKTFKMILF